MIITQTCFQLMGTCLMPTSKKSVPVSHISFIEVANHEFPKLMQQLTHPTERDETVPSFSSSAPAAFFSSASFCRRCCRRRRRPPPPPEAATSRPRPRRRGRGRGRPQRRPREGSAVLAGGRRIVPHLVSEVNSHQCPSSERENSL